MSATRPAGAELVLTEAMCGRAVAVIRLNRPDKLNALSVPMLQAFEAALDAAAIGRQATADLLLAGWRMTGERAYQLGLAAVLTLAGGALEAALGRARAMLKLAPGAQTEMKRLIQIGLDAALPTALSLEQEVPFRLYAAPDGQEGVAAFLEKRTPGFAQGTTGP